MNGFKDAFLEVGDKMLTALFTWGIGILLMSSFCLLVYVTKIYFGDIAMLISGVAFLGLAFFFIDLWWTYKKIGSFND